MANIVYIGCSLDGFIAAKDGSIDWLYEVPNPDGSDFGFSDFFNRIDAIVMGRNTFETVLGFGEWPYTKPVFVLSNTLSVLPEQVTGKAELIKGTARHITEQLHSLGYVHLYIDGGKTVQKFLAEGMIDELILSRIPVLLGDGIPLFSYLPQPLRLQHVHTTVYHNAIVKSHYTTK